MAFYPLFSLFSHIFPQVQLLSVTYFSSRPRPKSIEVPPPSRGVMTDPQRAKLIHLIILTSCIVISSLTAFLVLPSILDESYISRTFLIALLAVGFAVSLLGAILSMLVQSHLVSSRGIFTAPHMSYYLTSTVLGVIEVLLIAVFARQTRNIDTLDTTTFTDVDNFKSIFVYRDIFVIVLGFWAIRVYAYLQISLAILESLSAAATRIHASNPSRVDTRKATTTTTSRSYHPRRN